MTPASRHLVLVGLPGVGKTTVGSLLAGRLGLPFLDVDVIIAERAGKPVGRIFAEDGEAHFRMLERGVVRELLDRAPAVIAPGGGWVAQPGALEEVRERAFLIYLCVTPETAVARIGPVGAAERPLLAGAPLERMRNLLAAREGYYRRAHLTVDAGTGSPERLADRLARAAAGVAEFQVADQ